MMQEFKTSKGEFIGVLINPSLTKFDIKYSYLRGYDKFGIYDTVKLTDGFDYKIIGIQTEITEEQAKEIVDDISIGLYVDYLTEVDFGKKRRFDTALESFNSLMQKLWMSDGKWLIIQKIK